MYGIRHSSSDEHIALSLALSLSLMYCFHFFVFPLSFLLIPIVVVVVVYSSIRGGDGSFPPIPLRLGTRPCRK